MATILFLFGEDTYRSAEKLRAIKARYVTASLGDTNLSSLEGASLTSEEWIRQVQALPFLATSRLVVLRNLLTEGKKEVMESVAGYLEKIPQSTVVVFYEAGLPDQRLKLFKRLNQPKVAQRFDKLVGAALERWVVQEAQQRGFQLARGSLSALVAGTSDLWRLTNDLDKLSAFAAAKQADISADDVALLTFSQESADVFVLVSAIARQQPKAALEELDRLVRQGEAELYLFSMIVYQFRTLLLVADLAVTGKTQSGVIARELKMSPFVVEKTLGFVRGFSLPALQAHFRRLLRYDQAIKTGELEPRLALELLIHELAAPTRRHGEPQVK